MFKHKFYSLTNLVTVYTKGLNSDQVRQQTDGNS